MSENNDSIAEEIAIRVLGRTDLSVKSRHEFIERQLDEFNVFSEIERYELRIKIAIAATKINETRKEKAS